MRKIRAFLLAVALSVLALGLVHGQAVYAQAPPLQNVQVWREFGSGNTQSVQFRVFDPSRAQWMQDSVSYSPGSFKSWYISNLTNRNGVVAWQADLEGASVSSWEVERIQIEYAVYDPSRGRWMKDSISYSPNSFAFWSISSFTNQNGVVAWQAVRSRSGGFSPQVVHTENRSVAYSFSLGRWVDSNAPAPVTRVPMYQTYDAGNTDHFYTVRASDRDAAVYSYGYSNQGAPFQVEGIQLPGTVPFRRFYSWPHTDHIYLTDSYEISHVLGRGWVDEGVEGYIYTSQVPGTVPLYRLNKWNSATDDHDHQYTTDQSTVWSLQYQGWGFDRIQGYVWPAN